MSATFVPCSGCQRHVRAGRTCPWCGALAPSASPATGRGTRAAFVMATAMAATASVAAACSKQPDPITVDEPRRARKTPVEEPASASADEAKSTPAPAPDPAAVADADGKKLAVNDPPRVAPTDPSTATPAAPSPTGPRVMPGPAAYGGPPGPGLLSPGPGAYGAPPPAVAGPKGNASISGATFKGAPGAGGSVNVAIARNRWRMKACYQKELTRDPTAEGKVALQLSINASGDVVDAKSLSATTPAELTSCILAAARAMKFDPEAGTLSFTVLFTLDR